MRTLLIIPVMFCTITAYSAMPKCDSTKLKVKMKVQERAKKKKVVAGDEPDVRIQPNFMNLIY